MAFLTILTLICLTGFQVTSETASVRFLGRLGAALIELDRWLPAHRDDIQLQARDRPSQPLTLTDLPLNVTIPPSAANASSSALEATIRDAMGQRLYKDGTGAIQDDQGQSHLSITEPIRWAIGTLDSGAHGFWSITLAITGLALLAVFAGHFWMRRSPLPGFAVGSAIAVVPALIAWLIVTLVGSSMSGALNEELARVARDGVWLGVRDSIAATAIGLGSLYAYNTLIGPGRNDEWEQWDELELEYEAYDSYESEGQEAPPY